MEVQLVPGADGPQTEPEVPQPEYRHRPRHAAPPRRSPAPSGRSGRSARDRCPRLTAPGSTLIPLAAFALIVVLKFWVTRWMVLGDANPFGALLLEGGFALVLLAVLGILVPKWRVWVWLFVDVLASVLCIAVIMYSRQYEDVPTLTALGVARELGAVGDSVAALLSWWFVLYFVDVFAIALLFAWPLRTRGLVRKKPDARLLPVLGVAVVWVAVSIYLVGAAGPIDSGLVGAKRLGLVAFGLFSKPADEAAAESVDADIASEPADNATATATAGATATVAVKPTGKVDYKDPASVQARFDYLQDYTTSSRVASAPVPGAFKGRNVIMIQFEALATWTVGAKVGGHAVTPNIDKLIATSWYAPRTQTQIGRGNTSDAEFTANTSLLADRNSPASYSWGGKALPSLPRLLRAKGYEAMTFHPNDITYWSRNLLYPALGFSHWYSRPDFATNDIIGIGASDKTLFAKVASVLEAKQKAGKSFLGEVVTLSSHSPFLPGSAHSDLTLTSDLKGTQVGSYLRALHYSDAQLGAFIARLKQDGLWDDSVIILYGDHFGVRPYGSTPIPLTSAEKRAIPRVMGRQPQADDMFTIPFIVHIPGQTVPQVVDTVHGQVDIMPTVADLLGVDLSKTPHIGASLFDDRPRTVSIRYYAPDGTFLTNTDWFRPGAGYDDGTVMNLKTSKSEPLATIPKSLYDRMHTLGVLNKSYLKSLPSR